ncbi:protein-export chaperone SecB [Neisseria shayeganii]|uniref:Protein-export protein SecB n=1 Tax=Neisseria shayeganii 871 TaxID=1032488 RepID=G4CK09_9NEIS|nr:protein-export chaperone SecB [Neisseria shayeganii]EGY51828.1 protein-export chaperone SecB [Neisseria shayeganii 871]
MSEQQQPVFSIEKLYVKDLSLEVPHAPQIFLTQESPDVELKVHHESQKLEDHFYDVSVVLTVTAKLADGRVLFLNEVAQNGIFRLENIPEDDVKVLLGIACPNILYPYAREAVSSAITRAGFPPVLLAPINFEAMYEQQQAAPAGNA